MSISQFSNAASGAVPESAAGAALSVSGKKLDATGIMAAAEAFGNWVEHGIATPLNLLVELGKKLSAKLKFTEVAPGGRAREDIAPGLLAGKKTYKPQPDMFGVITPPK